MTITTRPPSPQITLTQGALRGSHDRGTEVFRNLPYAAAPVGELRWRPPQPPTGWIGERDAGTPGPASLQPLTQTDNNPFDVILGPDQIKETSEDCLHLTVRRPAGTSAGADLPVMVWVHGGAFQFGHGAHPAYDGRALVDRGVVLVNVNYRLGALGWLAHPELSAEDEHGSSGNYGALDVIAALQWIRDNITAFGGDPDRVTLFGESAGAMISTQLAGSPLARGLIHRVIVQSGSCFGPPDGWFPSRTGAADLNLHDAEQAGAAFLARLGVSSIAEARALDAEQITEAAAAPPGEMPSMFFRTNIDGYVLPKPTYQLLEQGAYDAIPVLAGWNNDESSMFTFPGMEPDQYAASLTVWTPHTAQILDAYPADVPSSAADLQRDSTFAWPALAWARTMHTRRAAPAYLYNFEHRPPYPAGPMDAAKAIHTAEIPYAFGTLDSPAMHWNEEDRALSAVMVGHWTNFAATGDPNGSNLPAWPAYQPDEPISMHFTGPQSRAAAVTNHDHLLTLDRYFRDRNTRA